MSKLGIYSMKGEAVGDMDVADGLLVQDRGEQAVHDVAVAMQNARRAGTASTKSKGEVAGAGGKPWRQKGTGRARAGYRQSPVWRGGAVAFGPKPRDYGVKVNRKVARLAFKRALSDRVVEGSVKVVDSLELPEIKTKLVADVMKALDVQAPVLIVIDRADRNVGLAARNLPKVEVVCAADLNVYQLLRYPAIVATQAAMKTLTERLQDKAEVTA